MNFSAVRLNDMCDFLLALTDNGIECLEGVLLSDITSFRIGGVLRYAVYPANVEELIFSVRAAKNSGVRYKVVGNTTNMLFSDQGFDGALIMTKRIRSFSLITAEKGAYAVCGCGMSLPAIALRLRDESLSGFEFACGIPATVGGAIVMNAGAHGGQMSDLLVESRAYDADADRIVTLDAVQNDLSYRHSVYIERRELICLEAVFSLSNGDKAIISDTMDRNNKARKSSQPLDLPSAGSFFKRPEGYFAAKLIDDCGLKGYRVGGACISEKHAGFIVNLGGATADDVLAVAEYAEKTVMKKMGIALSREVELVE